jgi:hypothetical protein
MASLITRLLSHYWTADDPEASRRAQIGDWLTDLGKFGPEILSMVAGQWRVREPHRPTIAGIHRLCLDEADVRKRLDPEQAAQLRDQRELRSARSRQRDLEMQLEGRELINGWARKKGFIDIDAYAAAKGIHWAEAYATATKEIIAEVVAKSPHKPVHGFNTAAALGVTAREWTPSEMSASRQQLGIADGDA